jgi:hypothetical protein
MTSTGEVLVGQRRGVLVRVKRLRRHEGTARVGAARDPTVLAHRSQDDPVEPRAQRRSSLEAR